jgi:hypothetical protein
LLDLEYSSGPDSDEFRLFKRRQQQANRSLVEAGRAEWFAVWADDGRVVSSLGIVALGGEAR